MEIRPFQTDRLVLITPQSYPFANEGSIAFRDVLEEPFVGLPSGSALQGPLATFAVREGRQFKLRIRLDSFENICAMTGSGVGLAIVPEVYARRNEVAHSLGVVSISDAWALRNLLVYARSFAALPVHARKLVDYLVEQRRERLGALLWAEGGHGGSDAELLCSYFPVAQSMWEDG